MMAKIQTIQILLLLIVLAGGGAGQELVKTVQVGFGNQARRPHQNSLRLAGIKEVETECSFVLAVKNLRIVPNSRESRQLEGQISHNCPDTITVRDGAGFAWLTLYSTSESPIQPNKTDRWFGNISLSEVGKTKPLVPHQVSLGRDEIFKFEIDLNKISWIRENASVLDSETRRELGSIPKGNYYLRLHIAPFRSMIAPPIESGPFNKPSETFVSNQIQIHL